MKVIALLTVFIFSSLATAGEFDVSALLKRDLGDQVTFVSSSEIRYCPDNTCDIYKASKRMDLLPTYVYLHVIHASSYTPIYRSSFIKAAKESSAILKSSEQYCLTAAKSTECILKGLSATIGAQECSGRYDEGHFCFSCNEAENVCQKL
jgi:hypothetical protein